MAGSRNNHCMTRSRFGIRRGRADDPIIRGAAIIRDHVQRLDDSMEKEGPESSFVGSNGDGNQRRNKAAENRSNSSFNDPWLKRGGLHVTCANTQSQPESHLVKKVDDDEDTLGMDSVSGGETFLSSSSQAELGRRPPQSGHHPALNEDEDVSITMSVRSREPDTDPCQSLRPPTRKTLGVAKVTTRKLLCPMGSVDNEEHDDNDDSNYTYDLVDRDYMVGEFELHDYDEVCGSNNYLPKDIRKNLDQGIRKDKRNNTQAQILQLATSGSESPEDQQQRNTSHFGSESPEDQQQRNTSHLDVTNETNEVISPLCREYGLLRIDPAYLHAQNAGHLWQSLVGSQIRFPGTWWNGARGPPMGLASSGYSRDSQQRWQFFGRYPSRNPNLRTYCKHRSAPGRLLLHIVVQDLVTWKPVQDIVVGCFDPNSRGIRKSETAQVGQEDLRELWLAVRKRSESVSVIDSLLAKGRTWHSSSECKNPLGPKQRVTNSNVRAVFGEEPPVESIVLHESTLYERLVECKDQEYPPLFLAREFVFC